MAFEQVFLVTLSPAARYDIHMHVTLDRNKHISSGGCDTDVVTWRDYEARIHDIVASAVGTRAKLVRAQHQPLVDSSDIHLSQNEARAATKKRKNTEPSHAEVSDKSNMLNVWIGIILDPETAFRLVDIGPSSDDDKLAKKFRTFWGIAQSLEDSRTDAYASPWYGILLRTVNVITYRRSQANTL